METNLQPQKTPGPALALHQHALSEISFIRDTMARSAPLTAVSGLATILMGLIAIAGSYVASWRYTIDWWIYVWLAVACAGCLAGFLGIVLKGRSQHAPFFSQVAQKFALNLFPPILAGCLLTEVFYERHLDHLMPGTWLLLYGVAIVCSGAFSVRILPIMGASFMTLGFAAFYPPMAMSVPVFWTYNVADVFLIAGFGGFHVLFGLLIVWRYGG